MLNTQNSLGRDGGSRGVSPSSLHFCPEEGPGVHFHSVSIIEGYPNPHLLPLPEPVQLQLEKSRSRTPARFGGCGIPVIMSFHPQGFPCVSLKDKGHSCKIFFHSLKCIFVCSFAFTFLFSMLQTFHKWLVCLGWLFTFKNETVRKFDQGLCLPGQVFSTHPS